MNRILNAAMGFSLMNAVPGEGEGSTAGQVITSPTPPANGNPDTPVPTPEQSAMELKVKEWQNKGQELANSIIAGEQARTAAEASLQTTQLGGCIITAKIADNDDRAFFIAGVLTQFAGTDGGKPSKTHANYLSSLRRVHELVKVAGKPDAVLAILEKNDPGAGGYTEKMKALPRVDTRGGGSTVANAAATDTTTPANIIQQEGTRGTTEPATEPAATSQEPTKTEPETGAAALSTAPARTSQQPDVSLTQLVKGIEGAHESMLEGMLVAVANRCKRSNTTMYQEIGAAVLDALDLAEVARVGGNVQHDNPAPMAQAH